ncbi:DUF3426 domain-containing protein [Noviherbaspirillum soli]|uniref:DUF3426 domain-containing protein n=1 Tax=Noviherbaspirillum soli TaxID=1064518 RepID=UPI00188B2D7F|nr:DUF3426 domain-containing protein [Noviherbaspirillum soli]
MATVLATRCPHCRTTFRVVQDQLKLRGGLVRCGACKEIFNGTDHLLRPLEPSAPAAAPQPEVDAPAAPATPSAAPAQPPADAPTTPAISLTPPAAATPAADQPSPDPLLRMTLMDFSHFDEEPEKPDTPPPATAQPPAQPAFSLPRMAAAPAAEQTAASARAADSSDELGRVIDDLKSKPWRGMSGKRARPDEDAIDALDSAEPDFVMQARRQQRLARGTRLGLLAGSAVLSLLLAFQVVYHFRVQLAAASPAASTMLAGVCRLAGCTVGLPAHIEMVTIESSELQALPGNTDTFTLLALLRNRSATRQQWPHIELTLNDANEAAVARRVIAPRDYLPAGQDPAEGFAPNSEQPARLVFNLTQVKAAGFRVYLFYP